MDQLERVPCPYCREMILPGALKCKECSSNLTTSDRGILRSTTRVWARNQADRKVLGVASCISANLKVSPTVVRLIFVLLTFVSLLGLFLYLALALIIPAAPGQRSAFETLVDMLGAAVDNFRHNGMRPAADTGTPTAVGVTEATTPAAQSPAPSTINPPAPPAL